MMNKLMKDGSESFLAKMLEETRGPAKNSKYMDSDCLDCTAVAELVALLSAHDFQEKFESQASGGLNVDTKWLSKNRKKQPTVDEALKLVRGQAKQIQDFCNSMGEARQTMKTTGTPWVAQVFPEFQALVDSKQPRLM